MLRNKATQATLDIISSVRSRSNMRDLMRDVMFFKVGASYDEVVTFFTEGVSLEDVQMIPVTVIPEDTEENPDSEATTEIKEVITDLSEYCLAGDVTDHRDGVITVVMGAKTALEKQVDELSSDSEALKILLGKEV